MRKTLSKKEDRLGRKYLQETADEGLLSKMHKGLVKLCDQKKNNPIFKMVKTLRCPNKNTYRQQISIYMQAPNPMWSGKYILKQEDATVCIQRWKSKYWKHQVLTWTPIHCWQGCTLAQPCGTRLCSFSALTFFIFI